MSHESQQLELLDENLAPPPERPRRLPSEIPMPTTYAEAHAFLNEIGFDVELALMLQRRSANRETRTERTEAAQQLQMKLRKRRKKKEPRAPAVAPDEPPREHAPPSADVLDVAEAMIGPQK